MSRFFYLICNNNIQHRIFRSVILVSLFHFLTWDLIDRINSYFRGNAFSRTCSLLAPNTHRSEAVVQRCSVKKVFLKICNIHKKTPVLEPLFNNFIKNRPQHNRCFHVNIAKFLRTAFTIEHLRWLLLIVTSFLH